MWPCGVGGDDVLVPPDLAHAGGELLEGLRAVPAEDAVDGLVVLHPLRVVDRAGALAVLRRRDDRAVDRCGSGRRLGLASAARPGCLAVRWRGSAPRPCGSSRCATCRRGRYCGGPPCFGFLRVVSMKLSIVLEYPVVSAQATLAVWPMPTVGMPVRRPRARRSRRRAPRARRARWDRSSPAAGWTTSIACPLVVR